MISRLIYVLALINVVFAASPVINTLVSGVSFSDSLPNTMQLNYYRIYVPGNALFVQTTLQSSDCSMLVFQAFKTGFPCGYNYEELANGSNICHEFGTPLEVNAFNSVYSDSNTFDGVVSGYYGIDTWFYLSAQRQFSSYETGSCTYTILMNITTCPDGQTGSSYGDHSCNPISTVTNNKLYWTDDLDTHVARIKYPESVSKIHITVESDDQIDYFCGGSDCVPDTVSMNCLDTSFPDGDSVFGPDYITYNLTGYIPRTGWFYFLVDMGESTAANFTFGYDSCPIGYGGYNCSYRVQELTTATAKGDKVTLPANPSNSFVTEGPMDLYYIDVPANQTTFEFNVTITGYSGQGNFYYRKDGYPEYEENDLDYCFSDGNECIHLPGEYWTFVFSWQDTYPGGRYYFGVQNNDLSDGTDLVYSLKYEVGANDPLVSTYSTSGDSTTGSTSSDSTGSTGGSGSTTGDSTGVSSGMYSTTSDESASGTKVSGVIALLSCIVFVLLV